MECIFCGRKPVVTTRNRSIVDLKKICHIVNEYPSIIECALIKIYHVFKLYPRNSGKTSRLSSPKYICTLLGCRTKGFNYTLYTDDVKGLKRIFISPKIDEYIEIDIDMFGIATDVSRKIKGLITSSIYVEI